MGLKISRPLLHCGMWRRVFWYFITNVLKKNAEDAGCRFFQNSGMILQKFQSKMLKM